MQGTEYFAPESIEQAIALLAEKAGSRPFAGGTDILVQLRSGRITSACLIDIKRIPGICGVQSRNEGFAIGAATPCALLGEHAELKRAWPGVVEAANLIGSTQIQGRATLAGNLCNASPAADSVPAMIAADARCIIAGPGGQRTVDISELPLGPGENALQAGEFVVEILLPKRLPRSADAYLRSTPRTEMDIAIVGAGVDLCLDDDGTCVAARVALGAVAPRPLLVPEAGEALVGGRLEDGAICRMEDAVREACQPIDDMRGTIDYRTAVAAVLARRAAKIAFKRAGESK